MRDTVVFRGILMAQSKWGGKGESMPAVTRFHLEKMAFLFAEMRIFRRLDFARVSPYQNWVLGLF